VVLDISLLVYDVFPWMVVASWFGYALEKWVDSVFFCVVCCFIIGFVYAIAYRCMRVLCTFKQTNT